MDIPNEKSKIIDLIVDVKKDIDELRGYYRKKIVLIEQLQREVHLLKKEIEELKSKVEAVNNTIAMSGIYWGGDKMKPEPLINKIKFLRIEGKDENIILGSPFVYLDDVKNAIEFYLKEVEKVIRENTSEDGELLINFRDLGEIIKQQMKIAFKDVLEDGKN